MAIVAGPVGGIPAYVASPLNLLFAAGALVQMAVARGLVRRPAAWMAVGAVVLIALGVEEVAWRQLAEMPRNLLYGLASAVLLAGAVATERRHPVAVPQPLMMLGAASYSLYLVHYPALSAVAVALRRTGVQRLLPATAGAAVLIVAVVALGIAVHVWVERPLLNSLQRLRSRAAPVTTAAHAISG